ncbi:MAG: zinc metallopeptidase [Lachnospiraceae bacterium]
MMYSFWDPTYWLIIIGSIICLAASAKVKTTYNKYSKVRSASGLTGAEAAERILRESGISDVRVQHISGNLNDHYDPKNKVLNLSDAVYGSASVAAVGVAAHECGHAIQHAQAYFPLNLRSTFVPIANFGSMLSWPMIIIGILLNGFTTRGSLGGLLIQAGIIFFSMAVIFQLITLPVELNASSRAVRILGGKGMLNQEELQCTRKVLTAAALTYVASAAAAILQLLRLVILFGGRDDRD